jgi:hypothetical protein
MSRVNAPQPSELPSPARLRRATLAAVFGAIFLTLVVVLPAEKGIDVTGLGRIIGLTEMGLTKLQLAQELAEAESERLLAHLADSADAAEALAMARDSASGAGAAASASPGARADITVIDVPSAGTAELLLRATRGSRVRYSWKSDGGVVDYVVKGDSLAPVPASFHPYSRGFASSEKIGVIVAAFDGKHGWYWRNTTDSAVRITLHTSGHYSIGPP